MRFQEWIEGIRVIQVGRWLAQHLPRWAGCGLAQAVGLAVAVCRPEVYWTVRANLSQVVKGAQPTVLDDVTRRVSRLISGR